ncbi:hypothetical protein NDU88_001497 [Pleurodeles waltl]|uniref:Uncharacterized protein n=1 Tax=Pleurodeles waltl TaxID=8319 RepID=A0AAV7KQG2_PLEWA|nr:hypothetical protein NDU88_001497 [Pleurodeles waltl]
MHSVSGNGDIITAGRLRAGEAEVECWLHTVKEYGRAGMLQSRLPSGEKASETALVASQPSGQTTESRRFGKCPRMLRL